MKILRYIGAAAMTTAMAATWAGEDPAATEDKLLIYTSQSINLTAVVEAIDHETRVVTLRGPEGNAVTFTATEEVRNLGQVETGDLVDVEYIESTSIEVVANPGLETSAEEMVITGRTPEGDMPGITAMDTQVVTATVEEINIEANTFKLKWPNGEFEEFTAMNPENLKRAEVGDLVIITHTEAMAIAVKHASAE